LDKRGICGARLTHLSRHYNECRASPPTNLTGGERSLIRVQIRLCKSILGRKSVLDRIEFINVVLAKEIVPAISNISNLNNRIAIDLSLVSKAK